MARNPLGHLRKPQNGRITGGTQDWIYNIVKAASAPMSASDVGSAISKKCKTYGRSIKSLYKTCQVSRLGELMELVDGVYLHKDLHDKLVYSAKDKTIIHVDNVGFISNGFEVVSLETDTDIIVDLRENKVTIYGDLHDIRRAVKSIRTLSRQSAQVTFQMPIPSTQVGSAIVGVRGSMVNKIKRSTNTQIGVDFDAKVVNIRGTKSAVEAARKEIGNVIENNFTDQHTFTNAFAKRIFTKNNNEILNNIRDKTGTLLRLSVNGIKVTGQKDSVKKAIDDIQDILDSNKERWLKSTDAIISDNTKSSDLSETSCAVNPADGKTVVVNLGEKEERKADGAEKVEKYALRDVWEKEKQIEVQIELRCRQDAGAIIGKKGAMIHQIKETTKVSRLRVENSTYVIIKGTKDSVEAAKREIFRVIENNVTDELTFRSSSSKDYFSANKYEKLNDISERTGTVLKLLNWKIKATGQKESVKNAMALIAEVLDECENLDRTIFLETDDEFSAILGPNGITLRTLRNTVGIQSMTLLKAGGAIKHMLKIVGLKKGIEKVNSSVEKLLKEKSTKVIPTGEISAKKVISLISDCYGASCSVGVTATDGEIMIRGTEDQLEVAEKVVEGHLGVLRDKEKQIKEMARHAAEEAAARTSHMVPKEEEKLSHNGALTSIQSSVSQTSDAQWKWKSDDRMIDYSPDLNTKLETAWKSNDKTLCFSLGKFDYSVDLKKMQQTNLRTKMMRSIERSIKQVKILSGHFPPYWSEHGSITQSPKLIELSPSHPKYIEVQNDFLRTCGGQCDMNSIKKIEFLCHPDLWESYFVKKGQFERRLGKEKSKERYLWHGTDSKVIKEITSHGFRRQFNKQDLYGHGVYFALKSRYSYNYAPKDKSGDMRMIRTKVLAGESCLGKHGMLAPPNKADGTAFESLVNSENSPTIYVISTDDQAYPEFVITFTSNSLFGY